MKILKWVNLGLRAILELGIVMGLAYWGFQTGDALAIKVILCVITPLLGFGFWGLVDFRQFGKISEYLRLFQELIISGITAILIIIAGKQGLGITLALVSLIHHALIYITGEKLLH
ncbi:MAG: YrdB family protein [Saprospiraceae bacterium]|nr:YrdB family protein [Saprospiraceae bacterium]